MSKATTESRFELARAIDSGLTVLRRRFAWLYAIALFVVVPTTAITQAYYLLFLQDFGPDPMSLLRQSAVWIGNLLINYVIGYVGYAALTLAALDALHNRPVSVAASILQAARDTARLSVIAIISAIALYGGLILLVVPGLYVLTAWSVLVPVRTIEHTSVLGTFRRSAELTRGHRWPLLGFAAGTLVAAYALALGMQRVVEALLTDAWNRYFAELVAGGILQALFVALVGTISATICLDLRAAKEGLVPEQAAAVFD